MIRNLTDEQKASLAKWIAALRSGKYIQGQGTLFKYDKYCCLGVVPELEELKWQEDVSGAHYVTNSMGSRYVNTLPEDLQDKYGLNNFMQSVLVEANDAKGRTFVEIAAALEQYLNTGDTDVLNALTLPTPVPAGSGDSSASPSA